MRVIVFVKILFLLSSCSVFERKEPILLHPIFQTHYVCSEHFGGQFKELGDALGSDCIIQSFVNQENRKWLRSYKNKGHINSDWYGYNQPVYSPISGTVVRLHLNGKENTPGFIGSGLSSFIIIKNKKLFVILAHVKDIKVKKNDKVMEGQKIALVGNNGQSWHPHIHIGAWYDKEPIQIQFDQYKMKKF